jgi:hypothetical protein
LHALITGIIQASIVVGVVALMVGRNVYYVWGLLVVVQRFLLSSWGFYDLIMADVIDNDRVKHQRKTSGDVHSWGAKFVCETGAIPGTDVRGLDFDGDHGERWGWGCGWGCYQWGRGSNNGRRGSSGQCGQCGQCGVGVGRCGTDGRGVLVDVWFAIDLFVCAIVYLEQVYIERGTIETNQNESGGVDVKNVHVQVWMGAFAKTGLMSV